MCFQAVTDAFLAVRNKPFEEIKIESEEFKLLEQFTILLYDKNSTEECINHARRELFSKKGRSLENIPPTKDALLQHIFRVIYQASIWFTSHERMPLIPSPEGRGWVLESNQLKPVWMTKPVAAKVCKELVRCHCQSEKGCRFCKCIKLGLTCTERCRCFCSLYEK